MEKMTEEEFVKCFGLSSEKAKQILERFRELVNQYVHETIEHADYYIDPFNYCDKDYLEHHLGVPIEKPEDDDGYTCLFEYGREHGAVETFMDLISCHTTHGGHTSAIRACELMGLEWERDL